MASTAKPHAVVVPFPAQGHITGLIPLANSLSSQGFSVSFVYLAHSFSLSQRTHLLSLHDPAIRIQIVPHDSHQHPNPHSLSAFVSMQSDLAQLVEQLNSVSPISCIISDTFLPWTQDVADQFGFPRIDFWASTATTYAICTHLPQFLSKGYLPLKAPITCWRSEEETLIDFIPGIPPFPINEIPKDLLVEDLSNGSFQFFFRAFSRVRDAERILIHSLYELEHSVFDALRADGLPVYSLGPLMPTSPLPADDVCLRWLDRQAAASVIYVSFGSYMSLSPEEIQEMAFGLEASEHPFIWVICFESIEGDLAGMLPEGFQSRTKERGMIVSWAPQTAVLGHQAVGGFLTHCGWNSTLEALWMGVPVIGCPRGAEQRSNLRFIRREWKVGLELERKQDGSFTRGAVERAVKALMEGEEGKEARARAVELRETTRKGAAQGEKNLQKLVDDMRLAASSF